MILSCRKHKTREHYKINKRGFTVIELIGAMVIISVLSLAGVSSISTSINNARYTSAESDFDGYRTAIQQFMLENPGILKTRNTNTIAHKLNEYLEDEMKFQTEDDGTFVYSSKKYPPYEKVGCAVKRLDPWGNPYRIGIDTQQVRALKADQSKKTLQARIFVISCGPNGTSSGPVTESNKGWYGVGYIDSGDDLFTGVQYVDGQINWGNYGCRNGNVDWSPGNYANLNNITKYCTSGGFAEIGREGSGLYRPGGYRGDGKIASLYTAVLTSTVVWDGT